MNFWITTDTHFGHDKMLEYCNRPVNFEDKIFKNFKKMLGPNDILIHLGDICIGRDAYWHEKINHVIPCKKWLIRGNHDKKTTGWYLRHGWDFVADQIIDTYFGKKVMLSHKPFNVGAFPDIEMNIHGHEHNSGHRLPESMQLKNSKHKLIALEYTNYRPLLLRDIVEGKYETKTEE